MQPAVVEARGLTKRYGSVTGVDGVSFDVRPGEVFGFLGPNGAGKTTTIRLMLDLIRPTSGSVRLFGLDARDDGIAIRRRTGYLPGEPSLYERMTGRRYLAMLASVRGVADGSTVRDLVDRLDLDLDRRIRHLSHGNRQKLALVQAFFHRPDLLILDEPTQGLDPLVQQEFYAMVDEVRSRGGTVFLSSHVLPEVERVCDRVAILRRGQVAAVEAIESLKQRALRVVELHFDGPVEPAAFERLAGVREAHARGHVVTVSVEGPVDPVVKEAAKHTVVEIVSHEPGLEDVFLAYFGEGRSR